MRKERIDKLPQSVPLQVGVSDRRKFRRTGRAKIQYMFSDDIYIVVRASNMPRGSYVIRKGIGDISALTVIGGALKRCEKELIVVNDFSLVLPELPTVTEVDGEPQEEILLIPGRYELRTQNMWPDN